MLLPSLNKVVTYLLTFIAKFVSQFTPELCKLESPYMVYIM